MLREVALLLAAGLAADLVTSQKQTVQLSDSYLPVAMQIIAHLTDQMAFEARDDVTPTPRPSTTSTSTTTKPTSTKPPYTWTTSTKPSYTWTTSTKPSYTWTTSTKPTYTWSTSTSAPNEFTTPFHKPGLYAPFSPPKPFINRFQSRDYLLPLPPAQYGVLAPEGARGGEALLGAAEEQVQPLVDPKADEGLLPPHDHVEVQRRSDGYLLEDISEDSLQFLSEDVRDILKMARDPHEDRLVDVWRQGPQSGPTTKAKMSGSNLRLLLLYDLLSRDAKKQKLSDFSGFSPAVMRVLVESSSGGARAQLRTALASMVDRRDCSHDYANNRAREMVDELAKDESKLSSEIRYLQPLVYNY